MIKYEEMCQAAADANANWATGPTRAGEPSGLPS